MIYHILLNTIAMDHNESFFYKRGVMMAAGTPPPPLHCQFAPGEISANIRVLFVSYPVLYMYCQSSIFCHRMWCTCHMYSDRCTTGCTAPPLIGEQQHCFHVIFGLAGPLHTISTVAIQPPPKLEFSMTSDTKLTLAEFRGEQGYRT